VGIQYKDEDFQHSFTCCNASKQVLTHHQVYVILLIISWEICHSPDWKKPEETIFMVNLG